ncbi:receptor-type tyrosine-protein phosphatase T-like [Saccostrea echinata]|uniref:receptor-type tyrosine-protein phosphatase T-like n=1 Tax=Saccostrea echinata TaxID=191078 RepID=UPI002A7EE359|nr:receptor-type tyrosine-protein phosphatase T-like [Saccostrea echinata]
MDRWSEKKNKEEIWMHSLKSFRPDENIALNKPAGQQHPYVGQPWGADKAVDGRFDNRGALGNQCTISANVAETATWWVNLGGVLSIHHITIYYRTDNLPWGITNGYTERFLGFSVYISNTTNKDDGMLCFKDTMYTKATIPNVTTIECIKHGRYAIYYNERLPSADYPDGYSPTAFNELCEFEVYGCPTSDVYGENCDLPCPQNCQEGHCNIVVGSCLGCVAGYKGPRCEQQCDNNRYGLECILTCGNCSNRVQCNHVNGSCPNGCDAGAKGDKCDQECPPGEHGKNCAEQCKPNCRSCNRFTGVCESGCFPGWKGTFCENECDGEMYGENCNTSCGSCLNLEQCHHINGTCLKGCDRGFQGEKCTEECPEGLYGYNCQDTCNINCGVPSRCNKVTGQCDGGCQAGWKGTKCDQKCNGGKFGINCAQSCGVCYEKEQCHHINGTCMNGCDKGYQGDNCTEGCPWKFYGYGCNETCSTECSNRTCDAKSGECTLVSRIEFEHPPATNTVPIIGGVVAAIIVSLAVVLFVVLFRRHRRNKHENDSPRHERRQQQREREENVYLNNESNNQTFSNIYENMETKTKSVPKSEKQDTTVKIPNGKKYEDRDYDTDDEGIENPYGDMYINEETIPDIPVNQLENIIAEKRKDEEEGFKREYAMLPHGEQHKCDAGKLPENVPRNRFKTTFPYDHSRVVLKDNNGNSDYINANFINGTDSEREYIASQGPKQNTLNDFWMMMWQENVSQIVMLTNLKEGAKTKCTQYWPEEMKARAFGNIIVKSIEVKEYAFYITRKLSVSHKELKKSRVVTHYHYTTWPDHGTPDPLCLVIFHDHVTRTRSNQKKSPTVVHCSAGIGRTGTYIALDALYKTGKASGKVNIAEYVKTMRANRMNMVQTYEQYMTIFLALNEAFKAPVETQTVSDFTQKAEKLMGDTPANQAAIRKEFELLMEVRPVYTPADYKIARQHNSDKNGKAILPLDKYSLYLTSSIPKRGSFINAINISSYTREGAFIVTKYPTTEDAVDFLRLLIDHESDNVICMNPLSEIESTKAWMADPTSSRSVPPFTVQYETQADTDVKATTLKIVKDEETHTVTIVEPKGSLKSTGTPHDTSSLRSLVSFAKNISSERPITVVSKDGATLCGVLCSVYNVIQQLTMDENVDVFTAVRLLQKRRPEFCSTQEEYLLIYRAVCDHIETTSENVYYNQ